MEHESGSDAITIWVAVNFTTGQPAPFAGWVYTRKALVREFLVDNGYPMKKGGYRPVKAQLSVGEE